MDKTDKRILAVLKEDARTTHETLATMLSLEVGDVSVRIERMERDGVIAKYTTVVNNELVQSDDFVIALIEVKVTPQMTHGFDSIAREIMQCEQVSSVYLMSGSYDLSVIVEGRNLKEVSSFVSARLSVMENVISTATHFILKKYKSEGVVLDRGADKKRQELV